MTGHLKLAAADVEDLQILSARLQDAAVKLKNISWLPRRHRFAMVVNRFRWEDAGSERVRAGLHFDSVLKVQARNIRLYASEAVVALLAVRFQGHAGQGDTADPGGIIELVFAGGGAIQLTVECIDAELADLTEPWAARARPDHDGPGHDGPDHDGSDHGGPGHDGPDYNKDNA